jgi:BlaI family penicillinase repressor
MDGYFDGSFKSMVSFFVKKNDMDISELESILKEINKKEK